MDDETREELEEELDELQCELDDLYEGMEDVAGSEYRSTLDRIDKVESEIAALVKELDSF